MKVSELIKQLQKMPKNLDVYWADHDHGEYETNAKARNVELVNKDDATQEWHFRQIREFNDTPKKYVIIRP